MPRRSFSSTVADRNLKGVGGWMVYFLLGQIIGAVYYGYEAIAYHADVTLLALDFVLAVVSIIGVVLTLREDARAPDYWVATTLLVCVVQALRFGVLQLPNTPESSQLLLRAWLFSLIWMVYWLRSKRVAATFGTNGRIRRWLDRRWLDNAKPVEVGADEGAPTESSPSVIVSAVGAAPEPEPRRRRSRLLHTLAGGLWSARWLAFASVALVSLAAFGYFVWPTPWQYYGYGPGQHVRARVSRVTGRVERFDDAFGWLRIAVEPPTTGESVPSVPLRLPANLPRSGRWISVANDSTHSIWIDSATLVGQSRSRSGWLEWVWATGREAENGVPYQMTKQVFDIDCDKRTLRLGENHAYGSDGNVVYVGAAQDSATVVVPESAGETILNVACSAAPVYEESSPGIAGLLRHRFAWLLR